MPLDVFPLWLVFVAALSIIICANEIGFRFGRARARRPQYEQEPTVGGIVAAELGLLAFMLAFTFGMGATRFEARREALLDEANAIGTTYLRTQFLDDRARTEARQLLIEYVDVRLSAVADGKLDTGIRRSAEIQSSLWERAVSAAHADARSIPVGLFVESLNTMIDLHSKRMTMGLRNRIPTIVWIVLMVVAALSFGSMGYSNGLVGAQRTPVIFPVALSFAVVLGLVVDVDRPQEGMLRVSQQPMIELRATMQDTKQ